MAHEQACLSKQNINETNQGNATVVTDSRNNKDGK
jgi:hypothetical protein